MFEGVVSYILNKYLSRYIENLDTDSLNISVWSGHVELTDLTLKPEALAGLELPVSVTRGTVGRISLAVPWTSLWSSPLVVTVSDVLVLAAPVASRPYDPELEQRLARAAKRTAVSRLERDDAIPASDEPAGFFERLVATILKNVQVFVNRIHVRYEDTISTPDCPLAAGLCIQSISAETTNSKWKPATVGADASSVYKLVRLESMSVYWNPYCDRGRLDTDEAQEGWRALMADTLNTMAVSEERLEFLVKPLSAKLKVILNLSPERTVPHLLADLVLQDTSVQLSRQQYLSLVHAADSFSRMKVNSQYRKYRPTVEPHGNAAKWWKYAYTCIVEKTIRPYSWERIKEHRRRYREYRAEYLTFLEDPDQKVELLDKLKEMEDGLDATGILLAREEAKIELARRETAAAETPPLEETGTWWGWLTGGAGAGDTDADEPLVHPASVRGWTVWSQLTDEEKQQLYESIGMADSGQEEDVTDLPTNYIKHKLNVTLSTLSASLLAHSSELLVATVSQLVSSVETRPAARSVRLSASAHSLLVEGTSLERDLVPIVSPADIHESDHRPVFSLDFEVNPPAADFGLSVSVSPVEVVYSEHAVSEVLSFLQTPQLTLSAAAQLARGQLSRLTEAGRIALQEAISRRRTLQLSLDLASPYLVIPETGTLQSGGNLLVVDLGRLVVSSELQPQLEVGALAEMTRAELEEAVYDRYRFTLTDLQLLFADSGDEWRANRRRPASDNHLLPKVQAEMVFSNSVQQQYTLVPRHKLDITMSACRLNLSDRRIRRLVDFGERLPMPRPLQYRDTVDALPRKEEHLCLRECQLEADTAELRRIRRQLRLKLRRRPAGEDGVDGGPSASTPVSSTGAEVQRIMEQSGDLDSEVSDPGQWARAVDQPGFQDNVSAHNVLSLMLRAQIPEVSIHLDRSGDAADRPYLLLVISSLSVELAQLRYGPAAQLTLSGLRLVDKLHSTNGGEYLELISTAQQRQLVSVLYRKVSPSCPEFSTVFHSVEQSLVMDIGTINVLFHRGAVLTLVKFLQYAGERLPSKALSVAVPSAAAAAPVAAPVPALTPAPAADGPPTPAGATRFSGSLRLQEVVARLCDTDSDFVEIKVTGAEVDGQLKANDKMILKASLNEFTMEDTSETTLYSKIISMEDDKLLELNVSLMTGGRSPLDTDQPVKPQGSVRLRVGRLHVLLLHKVVAEMQSFLAPFVAAELGGWAARQAERRLADGVAGVHRQAPTLSLSVQLHAPLLVIPAHSRSRETLLVNLGDLSVENLIKLKESPSRHVIDNIMIRLRDMQISRAMLSMSGDLEIIDPILAPTELRVDVQRAVSPAPAAVLPLSVSASLEMLHLDVAQSDVTLVYSVMSENLAEGRFSEEGWRTFSPELAGPVAAGAPAVDELVSERLQVFLSGQARPETSVSVALDGAAIVLYEDGGAQAADSNSPARDEAHALLRCEVGEARLELEQYSDRSLSARATLHQLTLADARPDSPAAVKRLLESATPEDGSLLELVVERAASGDQTVRLLMESTRVTLSVPFVALIHGFFSDACPPPAADRADAGAAAPVWSDKMPMDHPGSPSSTGSTSGYLSDARTPVVVEETGLTVTAQLRTPELVLLVDPTETTGRRLVLRAEVAASYVRAVGQRSGSLTLAGLQLCRSRQGSPRRLERVVLQPCDLSLSYAASDGESAVTMVLSGSEITVHLVEAVVRTLAQVVSDVRLTMGRLHADCERPTSTDGEPSSPTADNIWLPRTIEKPSILDEDPGEHGCSKPAFPTKKPSESLEIRLPEISVVFEREEEDQRFPVIMVHSALEGLVCDWSQLPYMKGEIQLQVSTFSDDIGTWEPLLEPVLQQEEAYRPYEVLFKVFRSGAHPISCGASLPEDQPDHASAGGGGVSGGATTLTVPSPGSATPSSVDSDTETEHKMRPIKTTRRLSRRRKTRASTHIVGSMMNSDSDSDDGLMEKIAAAFGHLFSSDNEDGVEDGEEADESDTEHPATDAKAKAALQEPSQDEPDGPEVVVTPASVPSQLATYVLVESRDPLELTVTPQAINVLREVAKWTTDKDDDYTEEGRQMTCKLGLDIDNQLGGDFSVTVVGKAKADRVKHDKLCDEVVFATRDVVPGSPRSTSPTLSLEHCHRRMSSGGSKIEELMSSVLTTVTAPVKFEEKTLPELYNLAVRQKIRIEAENFEPTLALLPSRSLRRLVALRRRAADGTVTTYQALMELTARGQHKSVRLTSPLQVTNGLSAPVSLLFHRAELAGALGLVEEAEEAALALSDGDRRRHPNPFGSLAELRVLQPGETAAVPLLVAYHCRLLVQPVGTSPLDRHDISEGAIWWKDLVKKPGPHFLRCEPSSGHGFRVVSQLTVSRPSPDELYGTAAGPEPDSPGERGMPVMTVRLQPAVVVHNHLPTAALLGEYGVPAGGVLRLTSMDPTHKQEVPLQLPGYRGTRWKGKLELSEKLRTGATATLTAEPAEPPGDGCGKLTLELRRPDPAMLEFYISVPYWLVNKTGLPLQVKCSSGSSSCELVPSEEPVLFRPRGSSKLKLSAQQSSWSPPFSVSAVETAGLVVCRDKERHTRYRILMSVSLSHLHPTKIITFKPYFVLQNNTRHHLLFMEENESADLWLDIAPRQVTPFWPATNSLRLSIKYRDSRVTSQWFSISSPHQTTLRMAGGSGLVVEVTGGVETPFLVCFEPYTAGDAPVRLENLCDDLFLKFHQQSSGQVMLLGPYQSMLYTWEDPTAERQLLWNAYNSKAVDIPAMIEKDGFGEAQLTLHSVRESRLARLSSRLKKSLNSSSRLSLGGSSTDDSDTETSEQATTAEAAQRQLLRPRTRRDRTAVFWVSYMSGAQRALLFTQDERQAVRLRRQVDGERAKVELFVSLRAAGLSLVTAGRQELLYASVRSAPAAWHVCVHDDWKPLNLEMSAWIEDKFSNDRAKANMKEYIEVDLAKMQMTRPFYGQLRRSQRPAVWLHHRRSKTLRYVLLRIHRPQVDCQIPGSVFPVVLHRVAPPRRVVEKLGVPPFLEACVLIRDATENAPLNIRHLKVLVQEFSLEVDKGLLVSLFDLVMPLLPPPPSSQIGLVQDLSAAHQPLVPVKPKALTRMERALIEFVHLSPIKLSFSFSPRGAPLAGGPAAEEAAWKRDLLGFLAESIGAPVTEVTDAELKLGYFERRGITMTLPDLGDEVKNHYKYQLLQEVYVLILGLDVLGNPYGLIKDFAHGVSDFFYEPYLGAMSGPEEFAEGVARGAQSLFGHVVGGAATSVSLLTESVGNMLSVLSFDEDYKRKRRIWMNQHAGLPETLLAAGRTFVMGIVLGLAGLVMHPYRGSRDGGVEGFFRGVGRGLLGLLTKPAGGVLDMVAMAMDGVSRAVELGEQVIRARLPRQIDPNTGIRPFSPYAARGQYLLGSVCEGRLARTDTYLAHAALSTAERSDICLVTDRHVLMLESSRLWASWDLDWSVPVADLDGVPRVEDNKLVLKLRKTDSHDWFRVDKRVIESEDTVLLHWLQNKIERALVLGMW
ncbi:vacuolar protein sorting-associated protein 13A-like [Amphibalanus amphitrite]|uniref:vacuolar protein sorting-associated protein 13A-like n=1 Tax=Amphibalanus amphitrite TaxID=1232801 RepID=UPI001C925343|nr:vacuolar protein sorting-associated protein 13A-like [Amphibalanus amphitrite]